MGIGKVLGGIGKAAASAMGGPAGGMVGKVAGSIFNKPSNEKPVYGGGSQGNPPGVLSLNKPETSYADLKAGSRGPAPRPTKAPTRRTNFGNRRMSGRR